MANAKWNSFPALTASELDDADLIPISDMSQAEGSRDRTASVGTLRETLGQSGFYDLQLSFTGAPADAAEAVALLARAVRIEAGTPGRVHAGTNPTEAVTLTIKRNSTTVGSISISAAGAVAWTIASPIELATGDRLVLVAPSPADVTLADVIVAFRGMAT